MALQPTNPAGAVGLPGETALEDRLELTAEMDTTLAVMALGVGAPGLVVFCLAKDEDETRTWPVRASARTVGATTLSEARPT